MPSTLRKRSYQEYKISDNDQTNPETNPLNLQYNTNLSSHSKKRRKYSESGIIYMINVGKTASYFKLGLKTDTSNYTLVSRYRTSYGRPNIVAEITFLSNLQKAEKILFYCLKEYQIENSETFKDIDAIPIYYLLTIIKELIHKNNFTDIIDNLGYQNRYTSLSSSLKDHIILKFKEKLGISNLISTFNFSREIQYSIEKWRKKNIKFSIKLILKQYNYNIDKIKDQFDNNIISVQDWCFLQNLPIPNYHELYNHISNIEYKFKTIAWKYFYLQTKK